MAGATGQGKSVGLNAVLNFTSLKNTSRGKICFGRSKK
jgi:hypothetical protein